MIVLSTKWSQEKNEEGNDGHLEWSEESSEEENEKEMANMCFMAIDELDEVNFNISDEDIHDAFRELYEDLKKLGLKNASLKNKVQQLEKELGEVKEKFSKFEVFKTHLEKRMRF